MKLQYRLWDLAILDIITRCINILNVEPMAVERRLITDPDFKFGIKAVFADIIKREIDIDISVSIRFRQSIIEPVRFIFGFECEEDMLLFQLRYVG